MTSEQQIALQGYGVELHPVKKQHLELLRLWRNDPQVSQFMVSQTQISEQQQLDWFNAVSELQWQQHFVICYRNWPIGAANVKEQYQQPIIKVSTSGQSLRLEPGIYLGDEKFRNNVLAFAPSLLLLDYCFENLGVDKLYATVHADNTSALNYNRKLGYQEVSREKKWVTIEVSSNDYQTTTADIKQFLSRRIK